MRYHKKEQGGGIIEGQKTAVSIFFKKIVLYALNHQETLLEEHLFYWTIKCNCQGLPLTTAIRYCKYGKAVLVFSNYDMLGQ